MVACLQPWYRWDPHCEPPAPTTHPARSLRANPPHAPGLRRAATMHSQGFSAEWRSNQDSNGRTDEANPARKYCEESCFGTVFALYSAGAWGMAHNS